MPEITTVRQTGQARDNEPVLAQTNRRDGAERTSQVSPMPEDTYTSNSQQRQPPRTERSLFGKILYEGFKIGLTIGLSIIASTFLTPIGGMIVGGLVTAAFSAIEQFNEKGKIDWRRVGIEFGLGFVSIGVGKIAMKAAGKFISKVVEKPLLSAAMNSGVQGGFTGGSLTAYDTYSQHGQVDWSGVGLSFVIGGIAGAGMSAGMHKISSKISQKNQSPNKIQENKQDLMKVKEAKILANQAYDEEIKLLAERLKVSPSKLKEVFPKIEFDNSSNLVGGIANPRFRWFRFLFNPKALISFLKLNMFSPGVSYRGGLKDSVHSVVAHETRHLEQSIHPLFNLSRKEYISLYANEALRSFEQRIGDGKELGTVTKACVRFLGKISGTSNYNRKYKLLTCGIKPDSSVRDKARAIEFLKTNVDCAIANVKRSSSMDGYLNCSGEVDARIYSMISRLRKLRIGIMGLPDRNLAVKTSDRLGLIAYEISQETPGFRNPNTPFLQEGHNQINSLIVSIKECLKALRI